MVGVELNADAVNDAKQNAQINGIKNARFFCADAGEFLKETAAEGNRPDVVFMDPPRAGSSKRFLNSLLEIMPQKVVYISCNPETMARDLETLKKGYTVKKLCPVDMFPHTDHTEVVALLEQKENAAE